jgi:hypothetical protein
MKTVKTIALFISLTVLIACSGNPVSLDKTKKAIISRNGDPFKTVVIDGGGKEVTYQGFDSTKDNSVIYLTGHNPGFIVSEGFGLNKDYVLKLKLGAKYSVTCYLNGKDQAPHVIYFKTSYSGDIIDNPDSN